MGQTQLNNIRKGKAEFNQTVSLEVI